jgi:hypothetical protein
MISAPILPMLHDVRLGPSSSSHGISYSDPACSVHRSWRLSATCLPVLRPWRQSRWRDAGRRRSLVSWPGGCEVLRYASPARHDRPGAACGAADSGRESQERRKDTEGRQTTRSDNRTDAVKVHESCQRSTQPVNICMFGPISSRRPHSRRPGRLCQGA